MPGGSRRLESSFVALRRLAHSFDDLDPTGQPPAASRRRSLLRLARTLGKTAVPVCIRELASEDDSRAEWAHELLAHIAGSEGNQPRVAQALAELAEAEAASDRPMLRALALLDELGAPLPSSVSLRDPVDAWQRSVTELAACARTPREAARLADRLVAGASEDHIAELARSLAEIDRRAAALLIAELDSRHEIGGPLRLELLQLAKHLPKPPASRARAARAAIELEPRDRAKTLARARELVGRGAAGRARLLLEGLLDQAPSDADARGALGLCLLALGEPRGARQQLERAVDLDPEQPAHLWNVAAAAHREGRPGTCYLALSRFLAGDRFGSPVDDTLEERRRRARDYIAEYERIAHLEHPGTAPETVARAEALYCEARLALARGDVKATIRALQEVVERVPTHYGAWTHLGMAQGVIGEVADARLCLERALALRPGDAAAHDALRSLAQPHPETAKRG
jgi:tetratricopeptide (TPR) repeat protein